MVAMYLFVETFSSGGFLESLRFSNLSKFCVMPRKYCLEILGINDNGKIL